MLHVTTKLLTRVDCNFFRYYIAVREFPQFEPLIYLNFGKLLINTKDYPNFRMLETKLKFCGSVLIIFIQYSEIKNRVILEYHV